MLEDKTPRYQEAKTPERRITKSSRPRGRISSGRCNLSAVSYNIIPACLSPYTYPRIPFCRP
ncbi:hypothetical protein CTAM01_13220 [Colletotrichum tamarilloi]|uniref:Uncharacterized protein n=1 Tax=Colletotrichum tamarilloi TaxID=1209934 RepID=A0ABQ9QST2_9PEZI|nr:uncharacterized protein CTAM01_13220 [Colletotrichum tamarilloi]KAK1483849.1 hypothetical protein CTAM01_13220 [Colletotrichum tamarilloi]